MFLRCPLLLCQGYNVLAAVQYLVVSNPLFLRYIIILRFPILHRFCFFPGTLKLCYEPHHLFCILPKYRQGLKNFFSCFFVDPQRVDKIVS